jgi:hypothetical protein
MQHYNSKIGRFSNVTKSFSTSYTVRKVLFLICILGLQVAALAQKNQSSWAMLSGLLPGQKIQVVDSSSKKHKGTFIGVSETAISIRVPAGEQSIQRQDVRTVRLLSNKRRARNTLVGGLVGGGIGAGVGAIIGAATYNDCTQGKFCFDIFSKGQSAGILAAIGGVGGAAAGGIIGALVPAHTTIYDVRSH